MAKYEAYKAVTSEKFQEWGEEEEYGEVSDMAYDKIGINGSIKYDIVATESF